MSSLPRQARQPLVAALWIASIALLAQAWIAFLPFQLDDHLVLLDPRSIFRATSAAAVRNVGAPEPTMLRWTLWSFWCAIEALQGRPLSPGVFHLIGLALHALACASIGACTTRLWGAALSPQRPWLPGLVAGLAAAIATGSIEAVSWPSAWGDSLATLFGCWTLLALLRARESLRRRTWQVAATLCLLLALFAKESAIVFPAILALAWLALRSRSRVEPAHAATASARVDRANVDAELVPRQHAPASAAQEVSAPTARPDARPASHAMPHAVTRAPLARTDARLALAPLVSATALYLVVRMVVLGGLNFHHGAMETPGPALWLTRAGAVARAFAQALYPWNRSPEFTDQVPWLARAHLESLALLAWAVPLVTRFAVSARARVPIALGSFALAIALLPCLVVASGAPTNALSRATYLATFVAWALWGAAIAALWSTPRARWLALACALLQFVAQLDARAHVVAITGLAVDEIEALDRVVADVQAEHARSGSELALSIVHICGDPGLGGIPVTGLHSVFRFVPPFVAGDVSSADLARALALSAGPAYDAPGDVAANSAHAGQHVGEPPRADAPPSSDDSKRAATDARRFEVRSYGTLAECERDWPATELAERDIAWIGPSGDALSALAQGARGAQLRAARMPRAQAPLRSGLSRERRAAITFRSEPSRLDPGRSSIRLVPSLELPAHSVEALELQFAAGAECAAELVLEAGRARESYALPLRASATELRAIAARAPHRLTRLFGAPIQALELRDAPPLSYQPRVRASLPELDVLEPREQAILRLAPDEPPRVALSRTPSCGAKLDLRLEIALQLPVGRIGIVGTAPIDGVPIDGAQPRDATPDSDTQARPLVLTPDTYRFDVWPPEMPSRSWGEFVREVLEPELRLRGIDRVGGAARVVLALRGSTLISGASSWRPIALSR